MAIYQFYLAVIPKKGLLIKHGQVPEKINVSTSSGYFESMTKGYWELAEIDSSKIASEIDELISRANYGNEEIVYNWKTNSESLDNDANMCFNLQTKRIEELSFRTDLREENLLFLFNMIELGKNHDWLFMDRRGMLANPDITEIHEQIRNSNNHRYLKDPYKYLKELNSGNNKKE